MTKKVTSLSQKGETRRHFIKKTASASAGAALFAQGLSTAGVQSSAGTRRVSIILDPEDSAADLASVRWSLDELRSALENRDVSVGYYRGLDEAPSGGVRIFAATGQSQTANSILGQTGVSIPKSTESICLVQTEEKRNPLLLAAGSDGRGLTYGLLELADMSRFSEDPLVQFGRIDRIVEEPANPIRSVTRLFTNENEDKPWFYDKSFWQKYLSVLISQRFNRFSLALGIGYDRPIDVRDSYFYFPYPFLMQVPGYDVRAAGLPDEERDRNLEMLQWISQEVTKRGLDFQLGLWTHAFEFIDSPDVNYDIVGLDQETHGPYCRDALQRLLKLCPEIKGVTIRCHSESGIPEGSYTFWKTVFEGVAGAGRTVEIDIHAKGIDHELIHIAVETGQPVVVSPKYWAEHMGLPYHQAAIRELERAEPPPGSNPSLERQRRFTRYGYSDYLRDGRKYGVLHRIWPGTDRFVLWGDPAFVAGTSRRATFCGSLGLELMEKLSFKGRRASGTSGSRELYLDTSLQPEGRSWEKYLYTYRLWGRLLYNPNAGSESWRRFLRNEYGAAANNCEEALAKASRVLPLVTMAHAPSAGNNTYWPEIYVDVPIVDPKRPHHYRDTPDPRRFGTVSPLDPAIFSTADEFVEELVQGQRNGKYSPRDVADWLEELSEDSEAELSQARSRVDNPNDPSFRRLAIDVAIQNGLGRFFAEKMRAAVAYSLFERAGNPADLQSAVRHCQEAVDHWRGIIAITKNVYRPDLSFGPQPWLRGHWSDRLAEMEGDLADMQGVAKNGLPRWSLDQEGITAPRTLIEALAGPQPSPPRCDHVPPASFRPGQLLPVYLSVPKDSGLTEVRLHYRHVNQAEKYRIEKMSLENGSYRFSITADYTQSVYPLLYFFELRNSNGHGWLYPGLSSDLSSQPYFLVEKGDGA